MTTYLYPFLSVIAVSLMSLLGVLGISLKEEILRKYVFIFISLAVGALLGDVFIHLVPEALRSSPVPLIPSVLVIAGILVFFALEKFLHWHHHGEDRDNPHIHPVGKLILFSDGIHNLIDGLIIGVSFMASPAIGFATTAAVILHEIPQEVGDFAVLLHSGYGKMRALWLNFLSALCAVLGLLIAFALGEAGEIFASWALPLAAGGFIYIAAADLIPELQKTKRPKDSILQILAVVAGVAAMAALTFLE